LQPKILNTGEKFLQKDGRASRHTYLGYLVYLIPIALIIIGYFALIYVTNESSPFTIVMGTSMQPTILPGSIAMLYRVPFNQLKNGDIIVFTPAIAERTQCDSQGGGSFVQEASVPCFVIHRIVKITTNRAGQEVITTKGDNNPGSYQGIDHPVLESQYVGMVVLQFPLAGYFTLQPYNYILAGILIFFFLLEFVRERRK
jgi:signal peptidase I